VKSLDFEDTTQCFANEKSRRKNRVWIKRINKLTVATMTMIDFPNNLIIYLRDKV